MEIILFLVADAPLEFREEAAYITQCRTSDELLILISTRCRRG